MASAFNKDGLGLYVQENMNNLLSASVLESRIMQMFPVQSGVQYKSKINRLNTSVTLAAGTCALPTDIGSVTFTQREIETTPITIYLDFCLEDLQKNYIQYNRTAGQETMPFENYIMDSINKDINNKVGKAIVMGTTASSDINLNHFNGWYKIMTDDADEIDLGTVSVSAYDAVEAVYLGIPKAVIAESTIYLGTDKYRVFANDLLKKNYTQVMVSTNYMDGSYFPASSTKVIPLTELDGTNVIFAGPTRDFLIGTDFTNGFETYEFKWESSLQKFIFLCKFNLGAQIVFPDDVVYAVNS